MSSLSLITASRWRSLPAKIRGKLPKNIQSKWIGASSRKEIDCLQIIAFPFPRSLSYTSSELLGSLLSFERFSSCSVSSRFPRGCDLRVNGCAFKGNDVVGNSRLFILSLAAAGAAFANRMRKLRTMPPSSSYSEYLTISEWLHPIGCRNRWFSSHKRPLLAENLSTRTA